MSNVKKNPNISKMEFPIFSIIKHRGKYILSGGAGAKNVGISDRLVTKTTLTIWKMTFEDDFPMKAPIHDVKADSLLEAVKSNERRDLLVGSSDEKVFFFRVKGDGELKKVYDIEVDSDKENARIKFDISNSGKYLACGGYDSFLRFYTIFDTDVEDEVKTELDFEEKLDSYINCISFSPEDDLLCVTTKTLIYVYYRKKKKLWKKFQIEKDKVPKRPTDCFFSFDQRYLYTIHSTRRSESYLARWDLMQDWELKVSKIDKASVTSFSLSSERDRLGITDNDGCVSVVDLE